MFTEYEIETIMAHSEVFEATKTLKKEFIKAEAPFLEISDEDFFSLIMMAPTVGIAMADGKISLFEEIALNKKARKLSKGGFFMKKDPVVYGMKFMIKNFDNWSNKFYNVLKLAIQSNCDFDKIEHTTDADYSDNVDYNEYKKVVLASPYLLIRFIASFFLENDEDIINQNHKKGKGEYERMLKIGDELDLGKLRVFQMFCHTFNTK